MAEIFAILAPDELQAVIERIEANGRGRPIGERMLARDAENDRPNHRD